MTLERHPIRIDPEDTGRCWPAGAEAGDDHLYTEMSVCEQ